MGRPRRPRGRKAASLSGSLLDRGSRDPRSGFVLISPDDEPAILDEAGPDEAPAEDLAPPPLEDDAPDMARPETGTPEPDEAQPEELADDDRDQGVFPLTSQHVIEALRRGHKTRAELILAELAGLTQNQARHALFRDGGRQLAIICRALAVEQLQFASIYILAGKLGGRRAPLSARDLAEMTAYYAETSPERAAVLLGEWQSGMVEILGETARRRR